MTCSLNLKHSGPAQGMQTFACRKAVFVLSIVCWLGCISGSAVLLEAFSLDKYDWILNTANEVCVIDGEKKISEEELDLKLSFLYSIYIESKSEPLSSPVSAESTRFLASHLEKVKRVHIKSSSLLTKEAIMALPQFVALEKLVVKTSASDKSLISADLSSISDCRSLINLTLDMEFCHLRADLCLLLPKLETLFFRCRRFQHGIELLDTYRLNVIEIHTEKLERFEISHSDPKKAPRIVHAKVCTNYMGNIPLFAAVNPFFYLEMLSLDSTPFKATEHTRVEDSGILPGTDSYTNRILAEKVFANGQKLYCYGKRMPTWDFFLAHAANEHAGKNLSFSTYTSPEDKNTITLPAPSQNKKHAYALTKNNIDEVCEFMHAVTIEKASVCLGKTLFDISSPENKPLRKKDWAHIVPFLHTISISYSGSTLTIPKCFYKLYMLDTITVKNSCLPNILPSLVAMPALRNISIINCVFDHANSHQLFQYVAYISVLDRLKVLTLAQNQSGQEALNSQYKTLLACLVILCIPTGLYFVSIIYYKKQQRESVNRRPRPEIRKILSVKSSPSCA
ncbi:uncharacterized protein NEMAJ01_0163 [Nematocida major]|uniref:uncharacterized protein n=1 Tax=Nematocida major TaxID=1912982 RepID=UPI0020089009|nr:uncharacterized protein NEMAJ01_0163 [Nematocida major]KAH9385267.1 hypothetical protein NEMAJ01_0163 [Nematocida major]